MEMIQAGGLPPGLSNAEPHRRLADSITDLAIIPTMAVNGILMAPLPIAVVLGVFAASVALALVLDQVKVAVFSWLRMA